MKKRKERLLVLRGKISLCLRQAKCGSVSLNNRIQCRCRDKDRLALPAVSACPPGKCPVVMIFDSSPRAKRQNKHCLSQALLNFKQSFTAVAAWPSDPSEYQIIKQLHNHDIHGDSAVNKGCKDVNLVGIRTQISPRLP